MPTGQAFELTEWLKMEQLLKKSIPVCILIIISSFSLRAQSPPATDVYLAEIQRQDERISLGAPQNITNRDGYDNQPFFLPDGRSLLYTSIRDSQADIYKFEITTKTTTAMTQTPESEYSPTPTPDGKYFSVVRVELDTTLTQRVWKFPFDGSEPVLVLQEINPVGYHAWGDENTLGLFVLGNPPTFQLADVRTGKGKVLAERVGRSMHKIPGQHAISFVTKISENEWWINKLDLATQEITQLAKTLPGSEDYAWLPDGSIVMGKDSKLYRWQAKLPSEWQLVADFSMQELKGITRLAVSADGKYLAVVAGR
jgi:hypothetical protein